MLFWLTVLGIGYAVLALIIFTFCLINALSDKRKFWPSVGESIGQALFWPVVGFFYVIGNAY